MRWLAEADRLSPILRQPLVYQKCISLKQCCHIHEFVEHEFVEQSWLKTRRERAAHRFRLKNAKSLYYGRGAFKKVLKNLSAEINRRKLFL